MARIAVLIGPTGAGKSVVGEKLVEVEGFIRLSSGQLLRSQLKDHPQVATGRLITSADVEHIIDSAVRAIIFSLPNDNRRLLLDGFPRTVDQAQWLEGALNGWGSTLTDVIHLNIDVETSRQRLALRGRLDDTPEAIQLKWEEYQAATSPVLHWYEKQHLLRSIDATGSPDDVYNRVVEAMSL